MNESILYTLAEVAVTLAGFSGLVVVFRARGAHSWSRTELRVLWFLIGDSFLVLFFSLLPIPLALANWSTDAVWGSCSALLGTWFIIANLLALAGEHRDRADEHQVFIPVISQILRVITIVAFVTGLSLWLSAMNVLVPRGQSIYVVGLITLLAFAAVEFLFFIGLMSHQALDSQG